MHTDTDAESGRRLFGKYVKRAEEEDGREGASLSKDGELSLLPSPSPSPSSSSSSPSTLKDFVHTVRVESGLGGRREGPAPAPDSPAVDIAVGGARERATGGQSRVEEQGVVLLEAGKRTGTPEKIDKTGMQQEKDEEEEEQAVFSFSSGQTPRTLGPSRRRRALSPVRRSEDLGRGPPLPST